MTNRFDLEDNLFDALMAFWVYGRLLKEEGFDFKFLIKLLEDEHGNRKIRR